MQQRVETDAAPDVKLSGAKPTSRRLIAASACGPQAAAATIEPCAEANALCGQHRSSVCEIVQSDSSWRRIWCAPATIPKPNLVEPSEPNLVEPSEIRTFRLNLRPDRAQFAARPSVPRPCPDHRAGRCQFRPTPDHRAIPGDNEDHVIALGDHPLKFNTLTRVITSGFLEISPSSK